MREILFRGKRKDNGEWVEGYYAFAPAKSENSPCVQDMVSYHWIITDRGDMFKVIPETVGQFTGLTDKNGKRIFEGDILKSYWDGDNPEDFCYEVVLWYENGWCIKQGTATPDRLDGLFKNNCLEYSEVVGNVYDNPELLEEGAE